MASRIVTALEKVLSLKMKYETLLKLEQCFLDTLSGDEVSEKRHRFSTWFEKTLDDVVFRAVQSGTMRKVDGTSLASIVERRNLLDARDWFVVTAIAQ